MFTELILEYPWWYVLLCILLGAVYAIVLYRKNELPTEIDKWVTPLLITSRATLVALLAFFLLNPLLVYYLNEIEKPTVVLVSDNSLSIQLATDSTQLNKSITQPIAELSTALADKYTVKTYAFGEQLVENLENTFTDKFTNIDNVLSEIEGRYYNKNLGTIVLVSDGIFNSGANPIYRSQQYNTPIYTIGIGDSVIKSDVSIASINANKIAFLGNKFPIEIGVGASKCKSKETKLKVTVGNKTVKDTLLRINDNDYFTTIKLLVEATALGKQKIVVSLENVENETNVANNSRISYIEVLEGRQNILIYSDVVHPDIAALKSAISSNDNYKVELANAQTFKGTFKKYSLVIAYQPQNANQIITRLKNENVNALIVVGTQTDKRLTQGLLGVNITGGGNRTNEATAVVNNAFSLFLLNGNQKQAILNFPPLITPFGNYNVSPTVEMALNQKIGLVETQQPLLYFSKDLDRKYAVLLGEGIWKWKLADYQLNGNHNTFNFLIQKTVQYLALKENKKQFIVSLPVEFSENKSLEVDAQLYNSSYEKTNEPDVSFQITNEQGNVFDFNFGKTKEDYQLNAGKLNPGKYSFTAQTSLNGIIFDEKGEFIVKEITLEAFSLEANHRLLQQLSVNTGGKFYNGFNNQIVSDIVGNSNVVSQTHTQEKLTDLIKIKWLFFVLLTLASLEWFIRKRNGGY